MRKRIVDATWPAIVPIVMPEPTPVIFLVDNGSLRPAATHSLRQWAERLEKAIGKPVWPVSLMHSDKVPASALDGLPAQTVDAGLREAASRGFGRILILPLFFGPSAALTTYLPRRIAAARQNRWGSDLRVSVAEPLDDGSASARDQLVALLEAGVLATRHEHALAADTPVVLVDHGTPLPEVNAVRNRLAQGLGDRLGVPVRAASMERRDGDAYAFNEPLLESAFDQPPFDHGPVIVSMLFLQPGRHAGPEGDVAEILDGVREGRPGVQPVMTPLVGEQPDLVELLVARYRQVAGRGQDAA